MRPRRPEATSRGSELYVLQRARDALALVCDELERLQGVYGVGSSEPIA
jgi:hypothetical protein